MEQTEGHREIERSRKLRPWRERSRRRDTRDKCAKRETVRHMDTKEQREGQRKKETDGHWTKGDKGEERLESEASEPKKMRLHAEILEEPQRMEETER